MDIKINSYKIKYSFVRHRGGGGSKARLNKTGINIIIFILSFVENCLKYNAMQDLSVWLRSDFNLPDIERFRNHTGKNILVLITNINY